MVADLEPFLRSRARALPGHARARALDPLRARRGLHLRAEGRGRAALARRRSACAEAVWGGVSMGGALSLWIASHAPSLARAVISISGPPYAAPESDRRWWAEHRPLVEAGRIDDVLRRERAPAHGRRGAGAASRRGPSATRSCRGPCAGIRRRRCWRCSTRPTRASTGSTTARASSAPCSSSAGSEDHFPTVAMSRRVADDDPGRAPARGARRTALSRIARIAPRCRR